MGAASDGLACHARRQWRMCAQAAFLQPAVLRFDRHVELAGHWSSARSHPSILPPTPVPSVNMADAHPASRSAIFHRMRRNSRRFKNHRVPSRHRSPAPDIRHPGRFETLRICRACPGSWDAMPTQQVALALYFSGLDGTYMLLAPDHGQHSLGAKRDFSMRVPVRRTPCASSFTRSTPIEVRHRSAKGLGYGQNGLSIFDCPFRLKLALNRGLSIRNQLTMKIVLLLAFRAVGRSFHNDYTTGVLQARYDSPSRP